MPYLELIVTNQVILGDKIARHLPIVPKNLLRRFALNGLTADIKVIQGAISILDIVMVDGEGIAVVDDGLTSRVVDLGGKDGLVEIRKRSIGSVTNWNFAAVPVLGLESCNGRK